MLEFIMLALLNAVIFLSFATVYCNMFLANKEDVSILDSKYNERIRILNQRITKIENELMNLRIR